MTQPSDATELIQHPLRERVLAELHARPFAPLRPPCRLLRFAFMTDPAGAQRALASLDELCRAQGLALPAPDARYFAADLSQGALRFERHNEFVTFTWIFSGGRAPFEPAVGRLGRAMRLIPQPGPLIAAVDLHFVPAEAAPDLNVAFVGPLLVASEVEDQRATVATDFKADADGFVRILVQDRGLSPAGAGTLAQRLLELETYRTLALLGLPQAQALALDVDRCGAELSSLMKQVQAGRGVDDNRKLLDRLTALAAQVERQAADSAFRFGATRAYAELVDARLDAIKETRLSDHTTLRSFLARRLTPAMRTAASVEARHADLAVKIARVADLLRTRVDIELESQNALQLRQMAERVRLQLRLQQTVEGLSVAAITYYVASVAHLIFEGLHASGLHIDPAVATAAIVPAIAGGVTWTTWRIRRRHRDEP